MCGLLDSVDSLPSDQATVPAVLFESELRLKRHVVLTAELLDACPGPFGDLEQDRRVSPRKENVATHKIKGRRIRGVPVAVRHRLQQRKEVVPHTPIGNPLRLEPPVDRALEEDVLPLR